MTSSHLAQSELTCPFPTVLRLAAQVDLDDQNIKETALHVAAGGASEPILSAVIKAVTSTDALRKLLTQANERGLTPLHCSVDGKRTASTSASSSGEAKVSSVAARLMSEYKRLGVSVDQKALKDGSTPLLDACRAGDAAAVNALLEAGADVRGANTRNETTIMAAVLSGMSSIVQRLVDAGADAAAATNWSRETALHLVASEHLSPAAAAEVAQVLIAAGADVNAVDEEEKSAVVWAAELGKDELVRKPRCIAERFLI